ncbi:glycosyltransferase [bacterium]|nr:glycosyltransferase [bacterium]
MPKKLRLLVIAHSTEKSGAPKIATQMAEGFAALGHDVVACYPESGGCEEEARAAGLKTAIVPNPVRPVADASGAERIRLMLTRLRAIWLYRRLVREGRFDAVWIGSYIAVLAGLGAWLARVPVVYCVQEDPIPTFVNRQRVRVIRRTAAALAFVARRSQRVFKPRPKRQPWIMLPNFADSTRYSHEGRDEDLRAKLGAAPEDVVFTTLAFIHHRKGIDVLLRAFRQVVAEQPQARLWIAGDNVATMMDYRREQEAYIAEHNLGDRVTFLGHRDDVPAVLHASDVFVLASRNEALPVTIIESMMAARPVVATDVGSVNDMIVPDETGAIVPPEDPDAFAVAMMPYAAEAELRAQHGAAGRARALDLYDRPRVVERGVNLIRKVLAARS